ncbi:MAG TPA: DUF4236 domain-containing protein [Vicinamibacterales bacterium]|nr:DUF4236 domain-containing protein [Vicinamibacterales bacterium]
MGYVRLFRRVHLAPGVTLNLAKRGPSLSFGVRGAHVTVGRAGVRRTIGLPGTGVFYTSQSGWHSGLHSAPHFAAAAPAQPVHRGWRRLGWVLLALLLFLAIEALIGGYEAGWH